MIILAQAIIVVAVCMAPSIAAAKSSTDCDQSCGGSDPVQYPFGFSSGCPIQLNCSSNGTVMIGEFPVQTVSSNNIQVKIPAQCGRPVRTLSTLFTQNYAPTSSNGILLQNCTSPATGCVIPSTTVQTNFDLVDCNVTGTNKTNNITCYSQQNQQTGFIDYSNLTSRGCGYLFSAISTSSTGNGSGVVLAIQVVELGWWLDGGCSCSENATCTVVELPGNGGKGYRCQCYDGFVGDGYLDGLGCWRDSSACHPSGHCGHTTRVVVAGVAAGATLMVTVGLLCCWIRRRSKSKNWKTTNRCLSEATGISIPIYPYSLIEKATNSFSEKQQLGTGAYGTVYAGKLHHNDELVAIKRIRYRDTESIEQVVNEIKLLSSVSHPNLVRLLGCCIDKGEQILIYEFMPNGTLSHHLHREGGNEGLKWPVRLKIALETAQAIAFLHSATPPIYHRDIKSTNILLDNEFKTKVADFGLSRLGLTESSHISTAPQGTPGYLDPQYHQNFHLSDKSDVYSLGVVLVEIITGLRAIDFARAHNEVNLASLATDRIAKGRLQEIIDPVLDPQGDEWTLSSVHKMAELAFRCLAYESGMRPSMMEVANELEQIGLSSTRWGSLKGNVADSLQPSSSCSSASSVRQILLQASPSCSPVSSVRQISLQASPSCSSVSSIRQSQLSVDVNQPELNSESGAKGFSPVSVQDPWLSEQSSPSPFSLLNHVVQ
ncbi:hypothetical protein RHMOL_Rhmol07G0298500 [Rhododendron molle]|uniref:Uncharacterized protein n=1 Tax=Rhododendron molle TaxID=49168 RepID=A0ACC0N7X0_RHOML|nr:hypothetical protein RHMOL_Rhmol07G0298500 [Rhododendron molle]